MTTRGPRVRHATADDLPKIAALVARAFLADVDEEAAARDCIGYEPQRSLVAEDGAAMVGHAGSHGRDMAVPGAVVPSCHIAQVAVAATHRRTGLMTALVGELLRKARHVHREPLAVLWSSEATLYGRLGFGMAATALRATVDLPVPVGPPPAGIELGECVPRAALPEAATVYERVWRDRPGWSGRSEPWWQRLVADPLSQRWGGTALRALVATGPAGPDGYALWRANGNWTDGRPDGIVEVIELAAATPTATTALWRFLLTMDLARTVHQPLAAADGVLSLLVGHTGRLRSVVADGQWLRIVDVPVALAGRRYATAVDVVLDVTDALLPENAGCWRLVAGPDDVRCDRTTGSADLAIDVRDLAALYLGRPVAAALADAGRVTELRAGALAATASAFGWHRAPSAVEVF